MSTSARSAEDVEIDPVVYFEPARRYSSTIGLAGLILLGFMLDIGFGGGLSHAFAWGLALVIVVGMDALTVRSARALRSITVTASEIKVGGQTVDRVQVTGSGRDIDSSQPVLGRRPGEGLPRGVPGLLLRMSDGSNLVVPTRTPDRLIDALHVVTGPPATRVADENEYEHLADVEVRADQLFRLGGYGDMPQRTSADDFAEAAVVFAAGRPALGFARIDIVDGHAHLEELSVLPRAMRRGIGTALVEAAAEWSGSHGYTRLTALTFTGIPWQDAFFDKLGFMVSDELGPGLVERLDWEHDIGMENIGTRVVRQLTLQRLVHLCGD